eukprot:5727859-Prymnesium_polylepis.1
MPAMPARCWLSPQKGAHSVPRFQPTSSHSLSRASKRPKSMRSARKAAARPPSSLRHGDQWSPCRNRFAARLGFLAQCAYCRRRCESRWQAGEHDAEHLRRPHR